MCLQRCLGQMVGRCVGCRGAGCIHWGTLATAELREHLPPPCPAVCPGMEVQCRPINTPGRCFWVRTAGSTAGWPLPRSTGTAWKCYPLKAERTSHAAARGQEARYQHTDVRGGLAAQTKATGGAGAVLAGHPDPSPSPTDGSEGVWACRRACTLQLQCLRTTLKRSYFYS